MNKLILEGILKLLAQITLLDGVSRSEERDVIEKMLSTYFSESIKKKYLVFYDDYLSKLKQKKESIQDEASKLNKQMDTIQKVVVFLHVIEIILADHSITAEEDEYLKIVADSFKIERSTYEKLKRFISQTIEEFDDEDSLILSNKIEQPNGEAKLHQTNKFDADLVVMRVPEIDTFFFRVIRQDSPIFISGQRLQQNQVYPMTTGMVFKNDKGEAEYYSNIVNHFVHADTTDQVTFEAKNLNFYFPNGKKGLHDINLFETTGNLIAIMGASGSGKSTLMNVLNGNMEPQVGEVKINGLDIFDNKEATKGIIGYIPQDDLLIEELTVFDNLYYAGKLCFSEKSSDELEALINKTLKNLGLYEAKDLKVGSPLAKTISGGQRKRLNIGLELLRQPPILFMDEPTSGLSSKDSENIMDLLRELTIAGKLIFVVIHQPSSEIFKMFDKLIVLDKGGYQVYYGHPTEGVAHFQTITNHLDSDEEGECSYCGNVNSEEIFNILEAETIDEFGKTTGERKIAPEDWHKIFKMKFPFAQKEHIDQAPPKNLNIPNWFKQWKVFVTRDLLSKLNNKQYIIINLLQAPLLAFLLAFVVRHYHVDELTGKGTYIFSENDNLPAYIFMSVIVSLFLGLTVSAEEIIKDARIRKRETFLNLSRSSYLFSKMFILFGISAIQTTLFVWVGNYLIGIEDMNNTYWVVLFTCSCLSNVMGLNISDSFNSAITIYILIPILVIPQLLLGGMLIPFEDINPTIVKTEAKVPFIGEIIPSRWALEALAVSEFKDNKHSRTFYTYDKVLGNAEYRLVYYIPTLRSKLENTHKSKDHYEEHLRLLKNEITKQLEVSPKVTFNLVDSLTPEAYNYEIGIQVEAYLQQLEDYYIQRQERARTLKDQKIRELTSTPEGEKAYLYGIKHYRNNALERLVKKSTAEIRIIEDQDHLIQKIYPVYRDPYNRAHFFEFRTHFYAPTKYFAGRYYSTLHFNVALLWVAAFLLYITLYFRVFYKLINFYSVMIQPKVSKRKKELRVS